MSTKIRSLLIGASVVVIVLGTFKMAMTLLDTGSVLQLPMMEHPSEPAAPARAPAPAESNAAMPAPACSARDAVRTLDDVADAGREAVEQFFRAEHAGQRADLGPAVVADAPAGSGARPPAATNDITGGSRPCRPRRQAGHDRRAPSERLPDGIGGPALRAAALKGDPAAASEIGVRFAEGKGVAADLDQAAKWYDRAAQAGVVPALFRLGTFYEKGSA